MKQVIKLNETQLKKIVSESVKHVLKEYVLGGNDYGSSYQDFVNKTAVRKSSIDDGTVNDLWLIGSYIDPIYKAINNEEMTKKEINAVNTVGRDKQTLITVYKLLEPIAGLMANRTTFADDEYGMTLEDIKNSCLDSISQLKTMNIPIISSSAQRIYNTIMNA